MSEKLLAEPLIVHLSGSYPPRVCGIADYSALLADALRGQSIQGPNIEVWTGTGEAESRPGIVRPVAPGWNNAGVRALVRELVAARPRLVHLQYERGIYNQSPAVCVLLPRLLWRAGLPLVTTFHALNGPTSWGRAHRAALLPLLWVSRNVVVCSHRQLVAVQRLPRIASRAALIPVGSVIPVLHERRREGDSRPLRLVYFGFVWRGRKIELLLRALKAVHDAAGPAATLDIVGGLRDMEYRAELERSAMDLGLAAHVRFRGALPPADVSQALAGADIVTLPFETGVSTGRTTLMAALAHAAPVVTLGIPDNMSPLFRDGDNMEIAPISNEAEFIARTVALAGDPARRARLSAGAKRLSDEAFSWPEIARQTLALSAYRKAATVGGGTL